MTDDTPPAERAAAGRDAASRAPSGTEMLWQERTHVEVWALDRVYYTKCW